MARVARLGIVIDSSGARRGAQETNTALKSIEGTAQRAVKELQKAAATLGVAFGIRGLQQAVDQYTLLDARLRQVTGSGAAFARVQQELFAIAQSSRASYAATIDLYTRLARSSDQLGISQAQLVSVTEAVSNAVRLSNASTGAAEAGLVQLGQAFASGTLRGDELRSIMEQLPAVAKAIADGLGVPIGKLREMGEAGELSGRKVALALESQREKLALLAGEIPTTIGQALQQLNNAFGLVVAGSDEAKSATQGIAGVLGETARFMVEYKDAVVAVTVALGVGGLALAAAKAGSALMATAGAAAVMNFVSLIGVVGSLTEALALARYGAGLMWAAMTGPIGLTIAGLTAVAAAVYLWRTRQKEATDEVKAATKSAEDLYAAAKNVAQVNWAPSAQLAQIQNLGGALNAARTGGKLAADAFSQAADQWKDTATVTRTFAQALAEGDQKAKTLLATTQAQLTLGAQVQSTIEAQTKAQRAAAKAAEDRATVEREYQAQVVQLGIELAERAADAEQARTEAIRDGERALANLVTTGAKNIDALRAEIAALLQGGDALRQYTAQQELNALITERLNAAKAAGLAITPQVLGAIVAEAAETQKLLRVRDALKGVSGEVFALPAGTADGFRDMDTALSSVAGTLRDVSQALNGTGNDAVRMLGVLASALDGLARAQERAKAMAKANQSMSGTQRVAAGVGGAVGAFGSGFAVGSMTTSRTVGALGGAAAGAATGAAAGSVVPGIGTAIGAVVGGLIGGIGGLIGASKNATQQLIAQRAAQEQLGQALSALRASLSGDGLSQALAQASAQFSQLRQQTEAAFSGRKNEAERNRVLAELNTLEQQRLALIRQQFEEGMRLAMGDLEVRRLRATGAEVEAEQLAASLAAQKEIRDAEEKFGKDSPYVAALRQVQEAEADAAEATRQRLEAEKAAQQARDRTAFGLDLTQRRQTLSGDTRGAFITGQTIAGNSALAQAQQLVDAGTITAEMFEQLRALIGDEMVAALDAFDAAVAESALQQREDLEVRALVASGRSAEAAQRQIEIANRRELNGVTDESLRAEILRVQAIEEGARALEAAADAERRRQEQNADIDRRMIAVLQTLDPARAKQLQQMQTEADRAREIAEAADDATRARLRELHAMEDAAEALAVLTKAQEEAARIAREQADFTSSLNIQYLRSQGRGFDADVTELNEWRTTQRQLSASLGFGEGSEQWRQIDAVYASRYSALIAGTMQQDTATMPPPTATDPGSITLGEDTIAVRSARSISESTALQLVDYAASQTALLRRLVQIAEGGSGTTGEALVSPSLDLVERRMGSRASTSAMLMGGVVR